MRRDALRHMFHSESIVFPSLRTIVEVCCIVLLLWTGTAFARSRRYRNSGGQGTGQADEGIAPLGQRHDRRVKHRDRDR